MSLLLPRLLLGTQWIRCKPRDVTKTVRNSQMYHFTTPTERRLCSAAASVSRRSRGVLVKRSSGSVEPRSYHIPSNLSRHRPRQHWKAQFGNRFYATPASSAPEPDEQETKRHAVNRRIAKHVAILSASQFVVNLAHGVIIPALPSFSASLGLGASGVGLILGVSSFSRIVLNPLMGRQVGLVGRKPLMIGGTVVSAIGGIATGLSNSIYTMIPCRVLVGMGTSASMAGTTTMMADITDRSPENRNKILAVQQTMINLAFVAGPAVGGFVCQMYDARTAFFLVGACGLVCSFGFSFLPETLKTARRRQNSFFGLYKLPEVEATKYPTTMMPSQPLTYSKNNLDSFTAKSWDFHDPSPRDLQQEGRERLKYVWRRRRHATRLNHKPITFDKLLTRHEIRAITAMHSALYTTYAAQVTVLPLHASKVFGASPGDVGMLFSAASLAGLTGTILAGYFKESENRKNIIVPSGALAALGFATIAWSGSYTEFVAGFTTLGFSLGVLSPSLQALSVEIASDYKCDKGIVLSLFRQAADIAFFVAPIGLGVMSDFWGTTQALTFTTSLVVMCCGYLGSVPNEKLRSRSLKEYQHL